MKNLYVFENGKFRKWDMADLPEWTQNRLLVGLIIFVLSTIAASLQGTIEWIVPIIIGSIAGLVILGLYAHHRILSIIKAFLANLPILGKYIVYTLLVSLGLAAIAASIYVFNLIDQRQL